MKHLDNQGKLKALSGSPLYDSFTEWSESNVFSMLLSLRLLIPDVDGDQIVPFSLWAIVIHIEFTKYVLLFYYSIATKDLKDIYLVSEKTTCNHQNHQNWLIT